MKIALVYDAVYPWVRGGGEVNVRGLAERLAARGHAVDVVGMRWWEGPAVREEDGFRLVGVCPSSPLYREDGRRRVEPPLRFAAGVARHFARRRYDLVDCCAFPYLPALGLVPLLRARRIPLTLTWFELWGRYWREYLGRKGRVAEGIERAVARGADWHLAISPLTATRLRALAPAARVRTIPSACEVSAPPAVPLDPYRIGWCGRALPFKDLPVLLGALARLPRDEPWRVSVVGDGPSLPEWKETARALGVQDRVDWLGFLPTQEEVFRVLAGCGAVVQTSRREGQGKSGLEALALGRPLLCAAHPEVATTGFVDDGLSALIFPAGDEGELARALLRLTREEGLRERLAAGAARVAAGLRWEAILPAVEAHYDEVAGAGEGGR